MQLLSTRKINKYIFININTMSRLLNETHYKIYTFKNDERNEKLYLKLVYVSIENIVERQYRIKFINEDAGVVPSTFTFINLNSENNLVSVDRHNKNEFLYLRINSDDDESGDIGNGGVSMFVIDANDNNNEEPFEARIYAKSGSDKYWLYNQYEYLHGNKIDVDNPLLTERPYEYQFYLEPVTLNKKSTVISSIENIPENLEFTIQTTSSRIDVTANNKDTNILSMFGDKLNKPENNFDESYQVNIIKNDLFKDNQSNVLSIKHLQNDEGMIIKLSNKFFLISSNANIRKISQLICKYTQFVNNCKC